MPTPPDQTTFERHTAVHAVGDGRYEATVDESWLVAGVANGGYVGTIALRALQASLDDDQRRARSLTLHFLSAVGGGPVEIVTSIERVGRAFAFLSARVMQDDKPRIAALAAFSAGWDPVRIHNLVMPTVAAADEVDPGWPLPPPGPSFLDHLEHRPAIGDPPFSGSADATGGGWIRTREPTPIDAPLLVTLVDTWPQALFAAVTEPPRLATIDLTVHFRTALPHRSTGPGDPVLCHFSSGLSADGFCEEDGQVWSADGELLAQSRQLMLAAAT